MKFCYELIFLASFRTLVFLLIRFFIRSGFGSLSVTLHSRLSTPIASGLSISKVIDRFVLFLVGVSSMKDSLVLKTLLGLADPWNRVDARLMDVFWIF